MHKPANLTDEGPAHRDKISDEDLGDWVGTRFI